MTVVSSLRLYKKEKLCSAVAISKLFSRDAAALSSLSFPLRAVWMLNPDRRSDAPIQFLVSIPKKKVRHAVDRVKMRRRVREAFRLHHHEYPLPDGVRIDLAFIYIDSSLHDFGRVEKAVCRLLENISHKVSRLVQPTDTPLPPPAAADDSNDAPTTCSSDD